MYAHTSHGHGLAAAASGASPSSADPASTAHPCKTQGTLDCIFDHTAQKHSPCIDPQLGLQGAAVVTSVPEASEPDDSTRGKIVSTRTNNSMFRGRVAGTPELKLDRKLAIVNDAVQRELIAWHEPTSAYIRTATERFVDTQAFGDQKRRKLDKIRDWANEVVQCKLMCALVEGNSGFVS